MTAPAPRSASLLAWLARLDDAVIGDLNGAYRDGHTTWWFWLVAGIASSRRRKLVIAWCLKASNGSTRSSGTAEQMAEMTWIRPKLVAQIRFVEWTNDGHLRRASFLGVRTDKRAAAIRREQ